MKKFTITNQEDIINKIKDALENNMFGMAVARCWDYQIISPRKIEFTLKKGKKPKYEDLVWFGYFSSID